MTNFEKWIEQHTYASPWDYQMRVGNEQVVNSEELKTYAKGKVLVDENYWNALSECLDDFPVDIDELLEPYLNGAEDE